MTKEQILEFKVSERKFCEALGIDDSFQFMDEYYWIAGDGYIAFWCDEPSVDDLDDHEYSSDLVRGHVENVGHFTLAYMDDDCGGGSYYGIFDNEKKMEYPS